MGRRAQPLYSPSLNNPQGFLPTLIAAMGQFKQDHALPEGITEVRPPWAKLSTLALLREDGNLSSRYPRDTRFVPQNQESILTRTQKKRERRTFGIANDYRKKPSIDHGLSYPSEYNGGCMKHDPSEVYKG